MAKVTRMGVIGAGIMGQNHLRVLNRIKNAEIAAVVDTDAARAKKAAGKYGCKYFTGLNGVDAIIDAAIIAVPTGQHLRVGKFFLERGIHCLIEKPLAFKLSECEELVKTAKTNKTKLLVGHVEHFNPAVKQLSELLGDKHKIQVFEANRLGYGAARIEDVDVALDLMVHDIDLLLHLNRGKKIMNISAHSVKTGARKTADYITALFSFNDGSVATLTASRITQKKVRTLAITSDLGYIELDFIGQDLRVYHKNLKPSEINGKVALDFSIENLLVHKSEPLYEEQLHFIEMLQNGAEPKVDGKRAIEALKIVKTIQEKIA